MTKKDVQVANILDETNRKESLQAQFEQKQREMVRKGMELGIFTHPSVVQISQELDGIHNQIMREEKSNQLLGRCRKKIFEN